ncbi:5-methyltetrahydropteroyltriglutamate--homocysteine methyltransferase [uncultured Roseburia sp.]|uniref:5-methyltetrahydropteroyltriglutamate--homocysteine S-methyltransferase n=1 Tax=Brotonthovivens ammoniilytica TaxID=2981725 RepID=A0ABT2TMY9_9FIRM|nr:5-methyltetrahydropteroyltriglutamate--homocysteine S-methyltransferase [Brotonthovivens ammoniilytica]MCU6763467.1 5-methyltetrahydropteroyltriglutamate--homocysteine S-methyltransferase [Brotonthovivens ammoniilytica]SCJ20305.1 5-methyltetrahydropteroyltriglutamate--homocysteine methyltransferase [uncultured Roseburia sp.]
MSNYMNMEKAPYPFEVVGSFLRPDKLKKAREKFSKGEIKKKDLTAVENEAVRELVMKEKEAGLPAVTDGEFRRRYWHLDFFAALEGVAEIGAEHWSVEFQGEQPKPATVKITGKIGFGRHPFLEDFKFMKSVAGNTVVKQTIPSPSMLHLMCCVREENYKPLERYREEDVLFADIAAAYQDAVQAFYAAGCRYLQFDDTSWGEFCDLSKREAYAERGLDLDVTAQKYVDMLNRILEVKPDDMVITMHVCRGNFRSTWFSSGGYEPVAEILFGGCHVDGFFLEYDSDRAGDFAPLRFIRNQKVVLGLVTSKDPKLECEQEIVEKICKAQQYVPLKQLCISPQCGFSSTEEGNLLTEEEQWRKVELVKSIAEKVWS